MGYTCKVDRFGYCAITPPTECNNDPKTCQHFQNLQQSSGFVEPDNKKKKKKE